MRALELALVAVGSYLAGVATMTAVQWLRHRSWRPYRNTCSVRWCPRCGWFYHD